MLVLSRKQDESIIIGDDIKVTVLGIANGQVKIGIEADRSIPVHREEIFNRIKAEQEGGDK